MYLNVTISTPVGVFAGSAGKVSTTEEDLIELRDTIQTRADNLNYFVLFAGDKEILIPGDVFANSVTVFTIDEEPIT